MLAQRQNGCMNMHPAIARQFWKALMDNASSLIVDANALLQLNSYGRARSLTILAQEELGKALWVYQTFERAWSTGGDDVLPVPKLKSSGRHHATKYMEAFVFGQDLAAFWGDYDDYDFPIDGTPEDWNSYFAAQQRESEAAGRQANLNKMLGFYVDLSEDGKTILCPADIAEDSIVEDLRTAAQVVEMLLIKDHSRMKFDSSTPYDSTHVQQHRLLPISHPDDWALASNEFRQGEDLDAMSAPEDPA